VKTTIAVTVLGLSSFAALAKLPPLSPEDKTKAELAKSKADYAAKVDTYQLCLSQDKAVGNYRATMQTASKEAKPALMPEGACAQPGPYAPPATQGPGGSPPLEASGAHSPAETATQPPSSVQPQAVKEGKAAN
jgi:hypothetical protein